MKYSTNKTLSSIIIGSFKSTGKSVTSIGETEHLLILSILVPVDGDTGEDHTFLT